MLPLFSHITTFVFDVDGVLTDGSLILLPDGLMARTMNIKDGYALQLAIKKGYRILVISGGKSNEVKERLEKLGITDIWMQVTDKTRVLIDFIAEHRLRKEEILYMGDDLPDLKAMSLAGLPCCPADAAQDIREASIYTSHINGGKGCARDVIEKVMKLRGHWGEDSTVRSQ